MSICNGDNFIYFNLIIAILRIKPGASCMLGKCSTLSHTPNPKRFPINKNRTDCRFQSLNISYLFAH